MHRSLFACTTLVCVACTIVHTAGAQAARNSARVVDARLQPYRPQPVAVPAQRGYVMPDGSVRIVGFDDMSGMVARWDALFAKDHAGVRFTPILKGNGTAIPAITYDMTLFAPEGGGATLLELLPYEKIYGSKKDPVAALIIRVAHGSLTAGAKMSPLAIIVNKANPIASITTEQVASIFSTGAGVGDVTSWTQLEGDGVDRAYAGQPIHPAGLYWDAYQRPEDEYAGEYMMYRHFGPFPGQVFSPNYEQFLKYADVVRKVAVDPLAIGIVAANAVTPAVKVLALPALDGSGLSMPTPADLVADRYPYARDLYLYIRREPGTPLDPLVAEYVRMVLSREGQQAVAADAKGYLPLNAHDAQTEMERLQHAKTWAPRSVQGPKLNFPFPSPEPLDK